MIKLTYLSDYFAYRPGSTGKTIVCFSGIGAAPRKFYSAKALSGSEHNLVFVNCPGNSWYLDGVPGLGADFRSAAAGLRQFLVEKNWFEHSIYWGGSMGGFGAILYGALENTANIVTCGAEWKLGISGSNSRKILCEIQKRNIPEYPDIPEIVSSSTSRLRSYWGDFAYHDFAAFVPNEFQHNVKYVTLKEYGHPLPAMIHEIHGIERFINHHLESEETFPFSDFEKGDLLLRDNLVRDLHIATHNGYDLHSEQSLKTIGSLRSSTEISCNQKIHIFYVLGRHYINTGQYQDAMNSFDEAISMVPPNSYPFVRYYAAVAAGRLGETDRIIDYMEGSPVCYLQTHFEYSEKAGELLLKAKTDSEGLAAAEEFYRGMSAKEKNSGYLATLEKVLHNERNKARMVKVAARFDGVFKLDQELVSLNPDNTLLISGVALSSKGLTISHGSVPVHMAIIKQQVYNLPSPGLAKLEPENNLSSNSRFKLIVDLRHNLNSEIELISKDGAEKMGVIRLSSHKTAVVA